MFLFIFITLNYCSISSIALYYCEILSRFVHLYYFTSWRCKLRNIVVIVSLFLFILFKKKKNIFLLYCIQTTVEYDMYPPHSVVLSIFFSFHFFAYKQILTIIKTLAWLLMCLLYIQGTMLRFQHHCHRQFFTQIQTKIKVCAFDWTLHCILIRQRNIIIVPV